MFTDRFLKVPIKTYHAETEELTGKKEWEDTYAKILPSDISEYFPSQTAGDNDAPCVQVYSKGGRAYCVEMSIEEFEKLLNDHQGKY